MKQIILFLIALMAVSFAGEKKIGLVGLSVHGEINSVKQIDQSVKTSAIYTSESEIYSVFVDSDSSKTHSIEWPSNNDVSFITGFQGMVLWNKDEAEYGRSRNQTAPNNI
jgi:hypothetical protein